MNRENLEAGEMPTVDRAKIHEIQDLLDLLADLFQCFKAFPERLTSEQ